MEDIAQTQLYTWHYLAFAFCMTAIGVAGHIVRGFVNPLPDRLSDSNAMDLVLSNGYNLVDVLFGTEYDDAGFYRLDSLKNLRVTVTHTVICGSIVYLFSDSFAQFFAANANFSVEWLWNLFLYRLENI